MIFDPPFRWFAPRAVASMFFGTSRDHRVPVPDRRVTTRFVREIVASRDLTRDGTTVSYHAFVLRRPG